MGEWGDRNDLQPYQIDQFIALARDLDVEPSISVRLHGGTPAAAAELVRYTNMIINLADEAQTVPLPLAGLKETTTAEIGRLDADHQAEWLHPVSLGPQQALTLPGQSITLFKILKIDTTQRRHYDQPDISRQIYLGSSHLSLPD
jgi:hypothetical protein